MCCYKTLKEANESLEILLKYFGDKPTRFVSFIEVREATEKPMYPYWVGVICDYNFFHLVDDWICGAKYPCYDFYSGPNRYNEFKEKALTMRRFKNINGTMEEM